MFDYFCKEEWAANIINDYEVVVFKGVIYELFNLLKKVYGSDIACEIIGVYFYEENTAFRIAESSTEDEKRALVLARYYQSQDSKKNISLVDALQVVIAQRLNCKVLTTEERLSFFENVEQVYSY